ncbi:MAG: dTDP-4-dehydrorhamnose 3,5-epimerase family protein, partial [Actinobacteria bacterium]|nr:dTDP-4-dehydrorhamnose 3,5-epimerase family protein [Actinomycetota bacterium]
MNANIDGVKQIPLKRIPDERGTVMHMLKRTDEHFQEFGEIYFSTIEPGVVKGWHLHHEMGLNYACIHGRIKLVIYDDRESSPTRGNLMEVFLGPANHSLVIIPPEVWNGFKGMGSHAAIVANCSTV